MTNALKRRALLDSCYYTHDYIRQREARGITSRTLGRGGHGRSAAVIETMRDIEVRYKLYYTLTQP
jgi:hypothetical protein